MIYFFGFSVYNIGEYGRLPLQAWGKDKRKMEDKDMKNKGKAGLYRLALTMLVTACGAN